MTQILICLILIIALTNQCEVIENQQKQKIWQRRNEKYSLLLEDLFLGSGMTYELLDSQNPLVELHSNPDRLDSTSNQQFASVIDIDQITNQDGSKIFVLLDFNSTKSSNKYSVWFGTFTYGDIRPTWGNQKVLTTSDEVCYSVKLFSKTIAFANCVSFKTNFLNNNKDILFSFSASDKSPVASAKLNGGVFDQKITDIKLRKMRVVQLKDVKFVMLFTSASQMSYDNNTPQSLVTVLTYDNTAFTETTLINFRGVPLDQLVFEDFDSTSNEVFFLSTVKSSLYKVYSFTYDSKTKVYDLVADLAASGEYSSAKKLAVKRYELDSFGSTTYVAVYYSYFQLQAYTWIKKDLEKVKEWDGTKAKTDCELQNMFVSRTYVVLECVGQQINIFSRRQGQTDDQELPWSDSLTIAVGSKALVSPDDRLYVVSGQSFTTYQMIRPYVIIKNPIKGKFDNFGFKIRATDPRPNSLSTKCLIDFTGQVAKDELNAVYPNNDAKQKEFSLFQDQIVVIEDNQQFIGPALKFEASIEEGKTGLQISKTHVKGQSIAAKQIVDSLTLDGKPLEFVSSQNVSEKLFYNFYQTSDLQLHKQYCILEEGQELSCSKSNDENIDNFQFDSKIQSMAFSSAISDPLNLDYQMIYYAFAYNSKNGKNTLITVFSVDGVAAPSTFILATNKVTSIKFDDNQLYLVYGDYKIVVYQIALKEQRVIGNRLLEQETIDFNKVSSFVTLANWKPISVFKSNFDLDVVFIQLQTQVLCLRMEASDVFLVSKFDLETGVKPSDISITVFEDLLTIIFINKAGESVFSEYLISNPYQIEQLVDRATFGYQFVSPLKYSYSKITSNIYILATEKDTGKLVALGFRSEEQDIDGLDSVTYISQNPNEVSILAAGFSSSDIVIIYNNVQNKVNVHEYPKQQKITFETQALAVDQVYESVYVNLYYYPHGSESKDNSIPCYFNIYSSQKQPRLDIKYINTLQFDMKKNKESDFELDDTQVVQGGPFIGFDYAGETDKEKIVIKNVMTRSSLNEIKTPEEALNFISTLTSQADKLLVTLSDNGLLRFIKLTDFTVVQQINIIKKLAPMNEVEGPFTIAPFQPVFGEQKKLSAIVTFITSLEKKYLVKVNVNGVYPTFYSEVEAILKGPIIDSKIVEGQNVIVVITGKGETISSTVGQIVGIQFSDDAPVGKTFSAAVTTLPASSLVLQKIDDKNLRVFFIDSTSEKFQLYQFFDFNKVETGILSTGAQIALTEELKKAKVHMKLELLIFLKIELVKFDSQSNEYTFALATESHSWVDSSYGPPTYFINIFKFEIPNGTYKMKLLGFPVKFGTFFADNLIDLAIDTQYIYAVFNFKFKVLVSRFALQEIFETPQARRSRLLKGKINPQNRNKNLGQDPQTTQMAFCSGGYITLVENYQNLKNVISLIKENALNPNSILLVFNGMVEKITQTAKTILSTQNINDDYYTAYLTTTTFPLTSSNIQFGFNIIQDSTVIPPDPSNEDPSASSSGEVPSTGNSSPDQPSTDTTSTQEPTSGNTSTDQPSTGTTSTEESSTGTTSTDVPSTGATSTEEPSTDTTSTEQPSTGATSTDESSTGTSSTEIPSTGATSTEESSTGASSKEEPSSPTSSTEIPSSNPTSGQQSTTNSSQGTTQSKSNTSSSQDSHEDVEEPKQKGLTSGQMVGIIFGSLSLFAIIAGGLYLYVRRVKLKNNQVRYVQDQDYGGTRAYELQNDGL